MSTSTRSPVVSRPAALAVVGVVTTDQATKAFAHDRAIPNPETLLGIVPTGSVTTTLLVTTGLLAVAIWAVARQVANGRCPGWLAGIPLAAAASNAIDRLVHGAVIDWIAIGGYVFNLADIAIVIGAPAVALTIRRHHPASRRAQPRMALAHPPRPTPPGRTDATSRPDRAVSGTPSEGAGETGSGFPSPCDANERQPCEP